MTHIPFCKCCKFYWPVLSLYISLRAWTGFCCTSYDIVGNVLVPPFLERAREAGVEAAALPLPFVDRTEGVDPLADARDDADDPLADPDYNDNDNDENDDLTETETD